MTLFHLVFAGVEVAHVELEHRRSLLIDVDGDLHGLRLQHAVDEAVVAADEDRLRAVVLPTVAAVADRLPVVEAHQRLAAAREGEAGALALLSIEEAVLAV